MLLVFFILQKNLVKLVFIRDEMLYICEWSECGFAFDDFDTFYNHVREHALNFRYPTDPSNRPAWPATDDAKPFSCLWIQCFSDSCKCELELLRHVLFHGYHVYLKALGEIALTDSKLSPCLLDAQARNLVPDFHDEFSCQWENCDVVTSCPKTFYRHADWHALVAEKQNSVNLLPCKWKDCSFTCKTRYKLKEHCRTHTHEKCYSCPNCGGLFSNKTKFLDHLRRQNTMESESYQCSHCFKYCASERILRDHMRHHVNNVKCSLCDMTCPTKSALQHHMSFRHSNEKPYSCNMCDRSFKSSNDLRRHQQTHDPVYSFRCEEEECNYVTKTLQNLRRHCRTCHEGPSGGRYECHLCERRYSRGTGLTKHLKKYHKFRWPAGHNRFRYKEYEDGIYRLQTVRFESVELSQELEALENQEDTDDDEDVDEQFEDTWPSYEESNHQETRNLTYPEYENQLHVRRRTNSSTSTDPPQGRMTPSLALPPNQNHLVALNQIGYDCRWGTVTPGVQDIPQPASRPSVEEVSNVQDGDESSRENFAARAMLDMQEAASLLTTLRNSGVTS